MTYRKNSVDEDRYSRWMSKNYGKYGDSVHIEAASISTHGWQGGYAVVARTGERTSHIMAEVRTKKEAQKIARTVANIPVRHRMNFMREWFKSHTPSTHSNPVYTLEGKEIVLVMASRGGKHEVKVFSEPYRYPDAPYSFKTFMREQGAMKQTSGGSGYNLQQILVNLAKMKYFAKIDDNINYIVKYDDLDFTPFYDEAVNAAKA